LPLPFVAVTPTMAEVPLLFGVGLSGAAAQWLLSIAFRNAPAAIVTVFNYSSIVWAMLFGWMIWNEWPLPTVLAGASIVIASNALVIWRESRARPITGARVRANGRSPGPAFARSSRAGKSRESARIKRAIHEPVQISDEGLPVRTCARIPDE
jgi:hypothetical protein